MGCAAKLSKLKICSHLCLGSSQDGTAVCNMMVAHFSALLWLIAGHIGAICWARSITMPMVNIWKAASLLDKLTV